MYILDNTEDIGKFSQFGNAGVTSANNSASAQVLNKDTTDTIGGVQAGTLQNTANGSYIDQGTAIIRNSANNEEINIDELAGMEVEHNNSILAEGGTFKFSDKDVLMQEILATHGSLGYHPINGKYIKTELNEAIRQIGALSVVNSNSTENEIIQSYRNKLFGSGFQFLDSVDRRFPDVNEYVGYEYLRNFINHSAILHVYPGLPLYQGGENRLEWLTNLLQGMARGTAADTTIDQKKREPTAEEIQKYKVAIDFTYDKGYLYEIFRQNGEVDASLIQDENLRTILKNSNFIYDEAKNIFKAPTTIDGITDITGINSAFQSMSDSANSIIDTYEKMTDIKSVKDVTENLKNLGVRNNSTNSGLNKMLFSIFFATKYQQRLFTIKYTYEIYMRYVNMLCRAAALFLNLTVSGQFTFPQGTLVSPFNQKGDNSAEASLPNFKNFQEIDWSNYRMIESADTFVMTTLSQVGDVLGILWSNLQGSVVSGLKGVAKISAGATMLTPGGLSAEIFTRALTGGQSISASIKESINNISFNIGQVNTYETQARKKVRDKENEATGIFNNLLDSITSSTVWKGIEAASSLLGSGINDIGKSGSGIFAAYGLARTKLEERTQSVEFMVEPISPDEQFTNQTGPSQIKQGLDQAAGIGSEVAFITQTNAIQDGAFGKAMEGALNLGQGIFNVINNLTRNVPLGGSFLHNLVSGAIGAVTGNRYIFPDIYQNSNSSASYNFKVNLISPYGDIYNYYMNIVVPLIHLYCLSWPRLVTANSSSCPFIMKAFIPGLMTCEMGIIDSMRVVKNSEGNRVSVNGFPLSVTVEFSIHELYHHNAISPWDDPLSVINNECLLDYLCNLSGVHPTYSRRQMIAGSLARVLDIQTNFGKMLGNYFGDALLAWFGMRFK